MALWPPAPPGINRKAGGFFSLNQRRIVKMNYLLPTEYEQFGIETATPEAWPSAATALINAHCRRTTLFIAQYVERMRLADHRYTLQLTYLPLAAVAPATNAITAARGRYSPSSVRRGDTAL